VKWHKAGGNWFKIFNLIDIEGSGAISFDKIVRYVRDSFPGLKISSQDMSDADLQGLWKAIDIDVRMDVTLKKFMHFFRLYGADMSMHQAPAKETVKDVPSAAGLTLSDEAVRTVASALFAGVNDWLSRQGLKARDTLNPSPNRWTELFDVIAGQQDNRITFADFHSALKSKLRVTSQVPDDTIRAFWRMIDVHATGEITRAQFISMLYRVQLRSWPELSSDDLSKIYRELNKAADAYYLCGGNWYKVFSKMDGDRSGEMEFEELVAFMRRPLPGLCITSKTISDDQIKGFWRNLDTDQSGKISMKEFAGFMRRYSDDGATTSKHKGTARKESTQHKDTPIRTKEQIQAIVQALDRAHLAYWHSRGVHTSKTWTDFFQEFKVGHRGRANFKEFTAALYSNLQWEVSVEAKAADPNCKYLVKGVTHDDLRALWAFVDSGVLATCTRW
jgi:Ca2+-binding EF-hand superfamily protein